MVSFVLILESLNKIWGNFDFFAPTGAIAKDKLVGPTGNLKFADPERDRLPVPTFLLTGPHAKRSVEFGEQWNRFGDQFEKVAEYPYQPSSIVLLNNMSASELRKKEPKDLVETITLYRLKK